MYNNIYDGVVGMPNLGYGEFPRTSDSNRSAMDELEPKKKLINPLTKKELFDIIRKNEKIMMQNQAIISRCTHKDSSGRLGEIIDCPDGYVQCNICGEKFKVLENLSTDEVNRQIEGIVNLFETIKLFSDFCPLSEDEIIKIAAALPYIKKLPKIFEETISNYKSSYHRY